MLLGDKHDLAVLHQTLRSGELTDARSRDLQALIGLGDQRWVELQGLSRSLGRRLFPQKKLPGWLVVRCLGRWRVWHD